MARVLCVFCTDCSRMSRDASRLRSPPDCTRAESEVLASLDALKKIATTLHVSTVFLLFDEHERGPDGELALQFEAISQLPESEQTIVHELLESLIIKYQSRRWYSARKAAKEES